MNYRKDYPSKVKAIITEAFIFTNYQPGELPDMKYYTTVCAWDTGAEHTAIAMEVVKALQLKPTGYTTVMVYGGEQKVGIYEVSIGLPNGRVYHNMKVYGSELDEYAILIGMDIIAETDFLITNKDEKTTFQFRTPSEGGIDLK